MSIPVVTGQLRPHVAFLSRNELEPTQLPFVTDRRQGRKTVRSFWDVRPNGDYGDECLMGQAYALEALQYMMMTGFTPLLTWIVMDMPRESERTGIEVGFLSTISDYAVLGASTQARRT